MNGASGTGASRYQGECSRNCKTVSIMIATNRTAMFALMSLSRIGSL